MQSFLSLYFYQLIKVVPADDITLVVLEFKEVAKAITE